MRSSEQLNVSASFVVTLSQLPVQAIKLDRAFLSALETSARTRTVTSGVVGLARQLGVEVMAEGVESPVEVDQLLAAGCHIAQGYYFSPPVAAEEVPSALARVALRWSGIEL